MYYVLFVLLLLLLLTSTIVSVLLLPPCHILPPSEIPWRLLLADFAGSGGKKLFHRIG